MALLEKNKMFERGGCRRTMSGIILFWGGGTRSVEAKKEENLLTTAVDYRQTTKLTEPNTKLHRKHRRDRLDKGTGCEPTPEIDPARATDKKPCAASLGRCAFC